MKFEFHLGERQLEPPERLSRRPRREDAVRAAADAAVYPKAKLIVRGHCSPAQFMPQRWRYASIGRKAIRRAAAGTVPARDLTYHGGQRIDRDALRSNGVTREPGHGWKPGGDHERGTTREWPVTGPGPPVSAARERGHPGEWRRRRVEPRERQ